MIPCTFRIDVLSEIKDIEERIKSALIDFSKYAIAFEISEVEKKPHYQGIVFSSQSSETYKKKMENAFPEWKGKRGDKCGKRSFAPVKELSSYQSYIFKDNDVRFILGYSDEEIASIPKWEKDVKKFKQKQKNEKQSWFLTLYEHCKTFNIDAHSSGEDYADAIIDAYETKLGCEPNDFQLKCYAKSLQRHFIYVQYADNPRHIAAYRRMRARQIIGMGFWVDISKPDQRYDAAYLDPIPKPDKIPEIDLIDIDGEIIFSD